MTEACAGIVQRDDPHLYATALFAPEPARSRLMVLYAFDCELSRATRSSKESMIPRMRLQWWRDVVAEAAEGGKPKAHEVAGPLARLFRLPAFAPGLDPAPFLSMVDGHEAELNAPFDANAFDIWARQRFGARVGAGIALLTLQRRLSEQHVEIADLTGKALAASFALRTAQARAAANVPVLVPGLEGAQIAEVAREQISPGLHKNLISFAGVGSEALATLREQYRPLAKQIHPALLPLHRERRVLEHVLSDGFKWEQLRNLDRPFDGLRLAWRALSGRF